MSQRCLILLGPPCSGKGTIAMWMVKQFSVPHLCTGSLFREQIALESEIGRLVNTFISCGKLVPDEIVLQMVDGWLKEHQHSGFVSDGFPRTLHQAKLFHTLLKNYSTNLKFVIYLKISRAVAEERVLARLICKKCGQSFHVRNYPPKQQGICDVCGGFLLRREDDTLQTLEQRWDVFEKETVGLIDFYRELGILHEINADGSAEIAYRIIKDLLVL